MTRIVAVVLVALTQCFTVGSCSICNHSKLTKSQQYFVLNTHNSYRSNLANGGERDPAGGFLPSAKNMYKLKWDCTLEMSAQKWADQCIFDHSQKANTGENLARYSTNGGSMPSTESLLDIAMTGWWNELKQYGMELAEIDSYSLRQDISHFATMAWSETTRVGCGVSNCNGGQFAIIVCQYSPPGLNGMMYEQGRPCKRNYDCTMYKKSSCSAVEGLCIRIK